MQKKCVKGTLKKKPNICRQRCPSKTWFHSSSKKCVNKGLFSFSSHVRKTFRKKINK